MSGLVLAQASLAQISLAQGALGLASGSLVGFALGLVGGGGSILAVPLMIFVVGVESPHVAIGTAAVAVAASALVNLAAHARAGTVRWRCAAAFALAGIGGAWVGARAGQAVDGGTLLAAFGVLMLVVAGLTLRRRPPADGPPPRLSRRNALPLAGLGLGAGALSGFFGIGGGFLVAPSLVLATGMSTLSAIGSSLLAVFAFGATAAATYAAAGLVDWGLAALFVGGAVAGGLLGTRSARELALRRGALERVFAALIAAVALVILARAAGLL